jgi:hypothetical protein
LSIVLFSACSKPLEKINYKCEGLKGISKFIYEEIIISDKCNCIVSGKVKYANECMTIALIDYGNGECDNIATKILCDQGNCFGENGSQPLLYKYSFDCNENSIDEGLVSPSEIDDLNNPNTGPQP